MATKHRVDRLIHGGPALHQGRAAHYETVAWFARFNDAVNYMQEFANDPLNTQFSFRLIEET